MRTCPPSGFSTPAMHASTVLFPAPDAPNSPHASPLATCSAISTVNRGRRLMTRASSTARPSLCEHLREPRKGQCDGEKDDEQRHDRRQPEILEAGPNR